MARSKARKSKVELDAKTQDLQWWLDDEPHSKVFSLAERIGRHLRNRQRDYLEFACYYDDSELASLVGGTSAFFSGVSEALTTNVVRRQVDTYTAAITKNRPTPMAITDGGNFGAQKRAKNLTKLFEGALDSVGYYQTRLLRIRDGAIFGSGFAHNYRIGDKLVHERVFPWELAVDPREAMRGKPRSLYRHTLIDRLVLMERFPEFAEQIASCDSRSPHSLWDTAGDESTSNLALVREAWHLPSADDMERSDGAHAICISNATLQNREYKRSYFPFSKNTFSPGLVGWFGEGMVKGLAPVQAEINEISARLQEAAYLTGSYVWVPDGSGLETDVLDNGSLTLIRSAIKPEFFAPNFASAQLFTYYETIRTRLASEITGISSMSTRGEIPQGLESGKAIRTFHQIASENLIPQGREDERDCIDTAWQLFDLMEEIHEERKSKKGSKPFKIKIDERADGRSVTKDLDYAKVRMDRDAFVLRTFPTSFLATTPEDRWSQVKEMADAGLFSQDEVLSLLDFPDVQRVLNLRGAPRKIVEKIIEKILDADDPKPIYPEPTMNLDLCVALGTLAYLEAKWIDDAPEANTSVLLDFIISAKNLRDGTGGPQGGSQDPNAGPSGAAPVNQPGGSPGNGAPDDQGPLYAPPGAPPMPPNAVAPSAMPPIPQV